MTILITVYALLFLHLFILFQQRDPQTSVSAVEGLQQKFRLYYRQEKPSKLQEKARLETTYNTLQTRLRLNNKSPYVPANGRLITDVAKNWSSLEQADKIYEVSVWDFCQVFYVVICHWITPQYTSQYIDHCQFMIYEIVLGVW